ncbi:16S rRNA (cytosine(1402)-N(4))-methyltransferase RsmH [Candidatus Saccharibacteria bacterium]|nr:16S rRNA (cytosine(1402)-N(4))-methyltransferase RsmH [Candidatus Saccharibacteria bacterium]
MKITPQQLHIPVLLDAVLDLLRPRAGESYLDLTAGYGGHARAVIARDRAANCATLVDRDEFAISHLGDLQEQSARIIQSDFLAAAEKLCDENAKFDMILLDLGVSSPQLDLAERGFSFAKDGPLDMRMDQSAKLTAAEIVNRWSRKDLEKILIEYGEEPPRLAAKIAWAIVLRRKKEKFTSTNDLAEVVRIAIAKTDGGKYHKVHPATKTFQAIRIAVNDELGQLKKTLPILPDLLNDDGRLAIISFHSLEDRIVKNFLKERSEDGLEATLKILTKHPISGAENDENPRARSAKLRAAEKVTTYHHTPQSVNQPRRATAQQ